MKLLSLFSGIGAFEKALDNLDIEYEVANYCEIDPYASKAYSLIHGVPESKNLGDITKVDTSKLGRIDMVTYGFPCQDISLAGKQRGFEHEGEQTRSGLFFEALRIIEDTKPAYAICENVKNLVSKRFKEEFEIVLSSLEKAGYNNYWRILNSKDFGIPQNRERVFIISIRKDIDDGKFQFPQPKPLELRLKDLLEDEVDDKYYLKKSLPFFIKNSFDMESKGNGFRFEPHVKDNAQIAKTITTRAGGRMDDNFVMDIDSESEKFKFDSTNPEVTAMNKSLEPVRLGNIYGEDKGTGYAGNVWDKDSICPTLMTMQGGNRQPMIVVKENNKKGFTEAYDGDTINCEQPNSKTRRGRVGRGVAQTINTGTLQCVVVAEPKIEVVGNYMPSGHDASRVVDTNGLAPTVKENHGTVTAIVEEPKKLFNLYPKNGQAGNVYDENCCSPCLPGFGGGGGGKELKVLHDLRIRKLTPKECFRLMGFDDKDIDILIENGISNTQLYKMAGNSIVVDVLEAIFEMLTEEV